jgi:hypothetical protein
MKDHENNDDRGTLDLSLIIEEHQKEVWAWKQKEMEWIKTQNQFEGTKRIVEELSIKIISLKKEIDRLSEENNNLKVLNNNSEK